jgi:hypothetical protein
VTARVSAATFVLGAGVLVGATAVSAENREEIRTTPSVWVAPATKPAASARVRLAWTDFATVPAAVATFARAEASSILERMEIETAWRRARPGETAREGEIRVVVLDRLVREPETGRPVLGATSGESRTFPAAWVHLAGVRRTLDLSADPSTSPLSPRETRDLGLALGRVIAHEAVHILAPTLAHGRGLMARALGRHALTGSRIPFEPGVAVVVRASLRGVPADVATPSGVRAATGSTGETGDEQDGAGVADMNTADTRAHAEDGARQ